MSQNDSIALDNLSMSRTQSQAQFHSDSLSDSASDSENSPQSQHTTTINKHNDIKYANTDSRGMFFQVRYKRGSLFFRTDYDENNKAAYVDVNSIRISFCDIEREANITLFIDESHWNAKYILRICDDNTFLKMVREHICSKMHIFDSRINRSVEINYDKPEFQAFNLVRLIMKY